MSAEGSPTSARGRPEQRAALLDGVVEYVLREGVATLSLRPLAAALGTSDRMLLYYFDSRDRLLVAVLTAVLGLQPDVPAGRLVVRPLRPAPLGAIRVEGLRIGADDVTVAVSAAGEVEVTGFRGEVVLR